MVRIMRISEGIDASRPAISHKISINLAGSATRIALSPLTVIRSQVAR